MTRRVLYVSGTRADFGLMQRTLQAIHHHRGLALGIVVTGMHLSPAHGLTVREIEASGLPIVARAPVPMEPTTGATMARGIGEITRAVVDAIEAWEPDLLLLLGDRGEMLAGAIAGSHLGVAVAHVCGGERSGTIDEPVRHAISKLSHLHFTATELARERLVRMGEAPGDIFYVGAPGLDDIRDMAPPDRSAVAASFGLDADRPIALMLHHPVLHEGHLAAAEARAIIDSLGRRGFQTVALLPNADAGSEHIRAVLTGASERGLLRLETHLARPRYLGLLANADVLIGNSSSGIVEAASFGTPVINVGSRQNLRERNANILDVDGDPHRIEEALAAVLQAGRADRTNIYAHFSGERAADLIAARLASHPLQGLLAKVNAY